MVILLELNERSKHKISTIKTILLYMELPQFLHSYREILYNGHAFFLRLWLIELFDFLSIWIIRFSSLNPQYFPQNVPGFIGNLLNTSIIPDTPSLNARRDGTLSM